MVDCNNEEAAAFVMRVKEKAACREGTVRIAAGEVEKPATAAHQQNRVRLDPERADELWWLGLIARDEADRLTQPRRYPVSF